MTIERPVLDGATHHRRKRRITRAFNRTAAENWWIGKVTYARGIIDAVTGVPLAHPDNAQYVAGYTYQPRPKGHGGGNRATPRTYSGPRF